MQKNLFVLLFFLYYLLLLSVGGQTVSSSFVFAQCRVSTFAGSDSGYVNAKLTKAKFSIAFGMCMDSNCNIFIADAGNNCIREIDTSGIVTTFAGSGIQGKDDGTAQSATFNSPTGICTDNEGNFFVADFENHLIRKIDSNGLVTTLAGSGEPGYVDGFAAEAMFNGPRGICIDNEGNLYIGDSWNHRIRKVTPDGNVTTYAGGGEERGDNSRGNWIDGQDTSARFYTPCGVACDNFGNIYVADALNHRIRKIDTFRNVTTLAGSGDSGWNSGGFLNASDTSSILNTPTELYCTPDEILFSDTFGNRIRIITNDGNVMTVAGSGTAGFRNGDCSEAQFNMPRGIIMDKATENIFVLDSKNFQLRLIKKIQN